MELKKAVTIEEFYTRNLNHVPENLKSGVGHFNVFQLDEFASDNPKPMPFNRRDYYKISLVKGSAKVHYADKIIPVEKQVLVFSNPRIPYSWEKKDKCLTGYFCVFTEAFFHQYGSVLKYPVFLPNGIPALTLTDDQAAKFEAIFKRMFDEISSDYTYKFDVLRNLTVEMIHEAMKLQPMTFEEEHSSNASGRITGFFTELLERQFPIENENQQIVLRSASEFAEQLNIHVNHLNRALKETLQKTTTELISERILQEAKILLQHTNWNIAEIGRSLGFEETAHFSNFFKKNTSISPGTFRKRSII